MIMEADVCDMFVLTVRTGDKTVEQEDGTTVPIFRCGLRAQLWPPYQNAGSLIGQEKNI